MIGYSLSLCIASIAEGKTAEGDVQKIIAATRAATPADFEWVIEHYDQRGEFERGKESQPTLVVG